MRSDCIDNVNVLCKYVTYIRDVVSVWHVRSCNRYVDIFFAVLNRLMPLIMSRVWAVAILKWFCVGIVEVGIISFYNV